MEFSFERTDFREFGLDLFQIIYGNGEIERGDANTLEKLAKVENLIPGGSIYLNSTGGNLKEGIALGRAIRSLSLDTHVRSDKFVSVCYSAAALAFLGGLSRYVDNESEYGVHRFCLPNSKGDLETGQILSSEAIDYISEMGVDPLLFKMMSQTAAEDIYYLTHDEMRALKVINNNYRQIDWRLEIAESHLWLKGILENNRGLHKLNFMSGGNGKIALMGFIESPDPAKVLNWSGGTGLIINGAFVPQELFVVARNNYVILLGDLNAEMQRAIEEAERFGVFIQPVNLDFYDGFEIPIGKEQQGLIRRFFDLNRNRGGYSSQKPATG